MIISKIIKTLPSKYNLNPLNELIESPVVRLLNSIFNGSDLVVYTNLG